MLLYRTPDTDAFVCKFNISHHYFTRCSIYSDPLSLYRAFLSLIYLIHYTGFDICCFHPFINHFANNYICNRITESTTLELVLYFYSNSLLFVACVQLAISQHWFGQRLGAEQATSITTQSYGWYKLYRYNFYFIHETNLARQFSVIGFPTDN